MPETNFAGKIVNLILLFILQLGWTYVNKSTNSFIINDVWVSVSAKYENYLLNGNSLDLCFIKIFYGYIQSKD